jgi:hypothetical protein
MKLLQELLERRGSGFTPQKIAGAKAAGVDLDVFFGDLELNKKSIEHSKERNKRSGAKVQ